jgi:hypothetical protein
MQTWWLSFCDSDKPKGQQFLGVIVVDVDEPDVARAEPAATAIRGSHGLPPLSDPGDQWMAAAIDKTHRLKVNPGGAVASVRLDTHPEFAKYSARYPRGVLLSRADLDAIDAAIRDAGGTH